MKNLLLLTGILLLLISLLSCNQKTSRKKKADKLQSKVEAIHDESMMNQFGAIQFYQDTLSTLISEIKQDSIAGDSARLRMLSAGLHSVNRSYEQMMEWMRNYKSNNAEMETEERIEYLKGEEQKVIALRDTMARCITKVKALIEKR